MKIAETPTKKYVSRRRDLEEIEADIRDRITRGQWSAGMMIPSRRDLAREYCVDLNVVQRAVASLIEDKTLIAGVGRGTFVSGVGSPPRRYFTGLSASEPPIERSASTASHITATVGIVATLWAYNDSTREPHDNWPAAMLHAFEWAMASMPHVTVKFKHARSTGHLAAIRELIGEGVDALAVITPSMDAIAELEHIFESTRTPIVIIREEGDISPVVPSVFYDSEFAGFQAAQHIVQRGYENVSFFNPYDDAWWTESRRVGVEAALRKAGKLLLPVPGKYLASRPDARDIEQRETVRSAALEFLSNRIDSWAVVAVNDNAGHALIDAAGILGLKAGRDFGLIGFDDLSESRILDMTSLHPPLDAMGAEAAKLLQNMMSGARTTTEVRLRSHLVARSSTQLIKSTARPIPTSIRNRMALGV